MQPWLPGMPAMPGPVPHPFAPPGPMPAMFHPMLPLAPGTVLADRYQVVRDLSESRCGFIYVAEDLQHAHAPRVLKTCDPRRGDGKDEDLFRREARLLQRIHHPRVPRGHGLVTHQGMLCAAQDQLEGQDLHAHVQAKGPLAEPEAIGVLGQVLEILVDLHGRSPVIVHRDLKPENLFRDPQGQIHLVDFGSATDEVISHDSVPLDQLTTLQTLGYAAPEQLFGLEAYPASDLFSLAASMLYLLTGNNPILLYDGYAGQLIWNAPVGAGLRTLLDEMLRFPAGSRLGSAVTALERVRALT